MIRHAMRTLCAATLVAAPLALTATPAQALTSCTVNGRPVSGTTVSGTAGSDNISCGALALGDSVNGLGGSDYIVINGIVAGTVDGGAGGDFITANAGTTANGRILGGADGDFILVGPNAGTVDGGLGSDFCRIASGNPQSAADQQRVRWASQQRGSQWPASVAQHAVATGPLPPLGAFRHLRSRISSVPRRGRAPSSRRTRRRPSAARSGVHESIGSRTSQGRRADCLPHLFGRVQEGCFIGLPAALPDQRCLRDRRRLGG